MHELSLTESLMALVEDEAQKCRTDKVKVVRVLVGALSHVSPDALWFCFDAVSRGTVAQGALLDIVAVPGQGWCEDCSKTVAMPERFAPCPDCGGYRVSITSGEQFRLHELEVE